MPSPKEVLDEIAADRAAEDALKATITKPKFSTKYSQMVMEMVSGERAHQVTLGISGKIPHACEDPKTSWGYRIGVLGEEFGEICKEYIEGEKDQRRLLNECIQAAAVAIACAESVCAKVGMDPGSTRFVEYGEGKDWTRERAGIYTTTINQQFSQPESDDHMKVMLRAHKVYLERNAKYKDVWKTYGWRGCLMQLRTETERAWRVWWDGSERGGSAKDVDKLIDVINYAVFTIRNIEAGNRDGKWYWE